MKFISWNVNGLRACVNKGFLDFFHEINADAFCIQETKLQEGQIDLSLPGYYQYWNYAKKKGYSGTAIFTKKEPLSVSYGIGIPEHDEEGRVITLEYENYYLITCYTPNSQSELARLSYRMEWEDAFLQYLKGLEEKKRDISETLRTAVRITKYFGLVILAYLFGNIILLALDLDYYVTCVSILLMGICFIYKLIEYISNKYCVLDVYLFMLYRSVIDKRTNDIAS